MPLDYVAKRILQLLLIVFIAVTFNFLIPRMIPGDPVESALRTKIAVSGSVSVDVEAVAAAYRARFGMDKPLLVQYVNYWGGIFSRDLGVSLVDFPQPVIEKIQSAVPWTLGLLVVSTLISFVVGSILGALIAWPRAPRFLHVLVPPFMLLSSVPFFLLAIILVFTFSVLLPWFPPGGGFDPVPILRLDAATVLDILYHAILPALALVLGSIGFWALGMRAMMVSILGEDFITFADSKGLPPQRIFLWYGMRNALLPQITSLAIALGSILSGAVLVEAVFGYPGLGGILFAAIAGKDYFVIQGIVLMLIFALALALFVVDLIYPLVDPRIRYQA